MVKKFKKSHYESNLRFEGRHYKLGELEFVLLNYLRYNTAVVDEDDIRNTWHYNSNGISVYVSSDRNDLMVFSYAPLCIDVKMVSERTPTGNLENTLKEISKHHRRIESKSLNGSVYQS